MALQDEQVSVGALVMGIGTSYRVMDFNPWQRRARADQGGPRPWNHGRWSGAEWQDEAVVPMTIRVQAADIEAWQPLHQQLLAAFAPTSSDVELRWRYGAVEYLMSGRPRMVEPQVDLLGSGLAITKAAFVGLDPHIYSATVHSQILALPVTTGGLTVPVTAPFTVAATVVAGRAQLTNAGTATVGLQLRIDGPVQEPRVSVLAGGVTSTLRLHLTLSAGQWLDIDTAARTVYLNGTASRRGNASGGWPTLPPGTHELAFDAAVYDAAAQLTASWRDAFY